MSHERTGYVLITGEGKYLVEVNAAGGFATSPRPKLEVCDCLDDATVFTHHIDGLKRHIKENAHYINKCNQIPAVVKVIRTVELLTKEGK